MPESDAEQAAPATDAPATDAPVVDAVAPAVERPFSADEPVAVLSVNERLLGARDLALAALHEITPAASVGPAAGYLPEVDGVISLRFENRLGGYPGWYWTVSVAQVGDEEPTVLEAELLPGDGALLAPEWVPWAERLADYRAHQAELAASAQHDADGSGELPGEDPEGESDVDDLDEDDLDDDLDEDDDAPRLHAGDLDGVDIDQLDESAEDEESVEDAEDSDEDEESDEDSDEDEASDEDDVEEE